MSPGRRVSASQRCRCIGILSTSSGLSSFSWSTLLVVDQARQRMALEERETQVPETVAMPAPTVWPLVTALGITLGCAGLVTHMAVSVVGLVLFLRGLVGWWRDVLPVEKHEAVPVPPPEQRAAPVQTQLHTVAR